MPSVNEVGTCVFVGSISKSTTSATCISNADFRRFLRIPGPTREAIMKNQSTVDDAMKHELPPGCDNKLFACLSKTDGDVKLDEGGLVLMVEQVPCHDLTEDDIGLVALIDINAECASFLLNGIAMLCPQRGEVETALVCAGVKAKFQDLSINSGIPNGDHPMMHLSVWRCDTPMEDWHGTSVLKSVHSGLRQLQNREVPPRGHFHALFISPTTAPLDFKSFVCRSEDVEDMCDNASKFLLPAGFSSDANNHVFKSKKECFVVFVARDATLGSLVLLRLRQSLPRLLRTTLSPVVEGAMMLADRAMELCFHNSKPFALANVGLSPRQLVAKHLASFDINLVGSRRSEAPTLIQMGFSKNTLTLPLFEQESLLSVYDVPGVSLRQLAVRFVEHLYDEHRLAGRACILLDKAKKDGCVSIQLEDGATDIVPAIAMLSEDIRKTDRHNPMIAVASCFAPIQASTVRLYHGTSSCYVHSILADIDKNAFSTGPTDIGAGFYVTPDLGIAMSYAILVSNDCYPAVIAVDHPSELDKKVKTSVVVLEETGRDLLAADTPLMLFKKP